MKPKTKSSRYFQKEDSIDFWKWTGTNGRNRRNEEENGFPFSTRFLQDNHRKLSELIAGPGGGVGIGCGIGCGFGLVGGVGYGGSPWNHLRVVFGVGLGCGVGVGFGYGQGIGMGIPMESLHSHLKSKTSDSNRRTVVQI